MSINRRHALGAFIGAATAGPSVVQQVVDNAVNHVMTTGNAAPEASKFIYDTVSTATGIEPEKLAMLKRVASGQFSDDDLEQATWWLGDYGLEIKRPLRPHPEGDMERLKSVSPAAKRVFAHARYYELERARIIRDVAAKLLKWS